MNQRILKLYKIELKFLEFFKKKKLKIYYKHLKKMVVNLLQKHIQNYKIKINFLCNLLLICLKLLKKKLLQNVWKLNMQQ